MKLTSTEITIKPAVPAVVERRFLLLLTEAEAQALKRLANCNLTLPVIMAREARDMRGVKAFLTDIYHELEAQRVFG